MVDYYAGSPQQNPGAEHPANGVLTVVPSDADNLATTARALYVGVTGHVSVVMRDGSSAVFENVPAGTTLPIRVRRVNATGTTASALVALL